MGDGKHLKMGIYRSVGFSACNNNNRPDDRQKYCWYDWLNGS